MPVQVRIVFEATYESPDEKQANASIVRIRSILPHAITDTKGGFGSGVTDGSVKIVRNEGRKESAT